MATWYCDYTDGNDTTGTGTLTNPYKTIGKCQTAGSDGDTVYCYEDTYIEKLTITKSLTINNYDSGTVTVQPAAGNDRVLDVNAASKTVVLDGINLDGSNLDQANSYGCYSDNNSTVTLKNLTLTGPGGNTNDHGIALDGAGTWNLYDCTLTGASDGDYVVYIYTAGADLYMQDCTVNQGADKTAIYYAIAGSANLLTFINTAVTISTGTSQTYCVLATEGQVIMKQCRLINKSTHNSAHGLKIELDQAVGHIIFNNTIDANICLNVSGAAANGTAEIKNNIFVCRTDHTDCGCVYIAAAGHENACNLDYNQYWLAGGSASAWYGQIPASKYTTLANWQTATAQEANAQDGDPSFTDRTGGDYTLTASSDCINQGVYVGLLYTGSAPDMGAHEYTGSVNAGVGLAQLDKYDGTRLMLAVFDGTLYDCDITNDAYTPIGGGFTPSDTNYWSLVDFADNLWCLTSAEALHKWTGADYTTGTVAVTNGNTTVTGTGTDFDGNLGADGFIKVNNHGLWHRISAAGSDTDLTLTTAYTGPTDTGLSYTATTYKPAGGSPPTGTALFKWDNRLWIFGDTSNPRRAYFSEINDGEDWTVAEDFVIVGETITGAVPLDDVLILFSRDRSWQIRPIGQVNTPYEVDEFTNVGVMSHWSIARDGALIFALTEEGVRLINGADNPIISERVNDKLMDTDNAAFERHKYAVGFINKPKHCYYLLYSSAGSSEHDRVLIYDYVYDLWMYDELGVNYNYMGVVEDSNDVPHVYGLGYDGYLYEYETSATTDDGTAIGVAVKTGYIDGGNPYSVKRMMQKGIDAEAGYTSVSLEHLPDGVAAGSGSTDTLSASASPGASGGRDMVSAYPQAKNLARAFQLRATHSASEALTLYGVGVGLQQTGGEDS